AIQEALTGHLVFSTLHTNDAVGAVTRLLDMEIEPFLISSSLEGLIAQRLVRLLCAHCKAPIDPASDLIRKVSMSQESVESLAVFGPKGCESCRYTGYRGRTAIYEMARITESFRRLIVEGASHAELKRDAVRHGMNPLRHDGWNKTKDGRTSIEEVLRTTMEEDSPESEPNADGLGLAVEPPAALQ
ncbi:MAG TPA: ATPase, T2SS/T4P/T4SS family, partial [Sumerlaeia bacterium]|nr:ATPase, T2SS/T4P/T4SS family [Sumerlaeia bacterium]